MFESKTKLTPTAKKMTKANKQEMDKPAFSKLGYRQGDSGNSIIFYYSKNSPDMTATPSENC